MKLYVLTRSEYAKRLGITPNAVRMKMRRGLLSGEYRFDGGKYIFKEPERPGDYIENDPLENSKMTTPKKKYNRGNHFQASYPNEAFRLRNELLMYNKIKKNLPDEVINEINPELIKLAEERAKKRKDDALKTSFITPKNYGGPVGLRPRYNSYDRERFKEDLSSSSFNPHHNRNYYDMGGYDDGSVEVDVSRSNRTPTFKNKIEEEVYYHPNNKKK